MTLRLDGGRARDPIEERGGSNLYNFVNGDPCNHFDRDGLKKVRQDLCVVGRHHGDSANESGCDKTYYAQCYTTPNGGSLWPTRTDFDLAKQANRADWQPDDSIMSEELSRQIEIAESDAPSFCTGDVCSVTIKVRLDFSGEMLRARTDPLVRLAEGYTNNYDCKKKGGPKISFAT